MRGTGGGVAEEDDTVAGAGEALAVFGEVKERIRDHGAVTYRPAARAASGDDYPARAAPGDDYPAIAVDTGIGEGADPGDHRAVAGLVPFGAAGGFVGVELGQELGAEMERGKGDVDGLAGLDARGEAAQGAVGLGVEDLGQGVEREGIG